jgi:2-keto-4-pentenoate hydratase/2-oxohepta-3-ene-1,7-dioic acid hydratase in catechol pathway
MRIATYHHQGELHVGHVVDDGVAPFPAGTHVAEALLATPEDRAALAAASGPPVPVTEVRFAPPVEPGAYRDFVTFERHVEGIVKSMGQGTVVDQWYEAPTFYFGNPYAMVGAHDDVPVPPGCEVFDFELEVAAIIGRPGRDLSPEEAGAHIAGYTILNDWSARDLQRREMAVGLGPAKGKDTANTLGPWIVTADEFEYARRDGQLDLAMTASINGEVVGTDRLANMAWRFEDMVAYASRGAWVRTGDVLGSGTCGSGCLAELWGRRGEQDPPPLQVGDVVGLEVEGLGAVRNRIVAGVDPRPVPSARRVAAAAAPTG